MTAAFCLHSSVTKPCKYGILSAMCKSLVDVRLGKSPMVFHQVKSSQVKSSQVILLLTISQSVSPSWPRAPNFDTWPYFSFEEYFGIVFCGASTPREDGSAMYRGHGLFLSRVYSYSCVYVYPVLILLLLFRAVIAQSV
jgi:hypothetical protein